MESLCIYRLVNKIDELLPSKSTTLLFDLLSSNVLYSRSSSLSPTLLYSCRGFSRLSILPGHRFSVAMLKLFAPRTTAQHFVTTQYQL